MFDTIVALATAPLKGALAIIRVSGKDSLYIFSKVFSENVEKTTGRKIYHGQIVDGNEVIDDVLALVFVAPNSFTGENAVEIDCHGSMLIANQIIEVLLKNGARLAGKGEFSSRAFLNGKMDLIQAEAVNDMINATTREAKKLSLLSLNGEASKLISPIKTKIADLVSNIEVNIDYPEYEDIGVITKNDIIEQVNLINELIDKTINEGKQGKIIKEGLNVAIVGKPNVGKSSILNAFLKEDKAIVTSIPGTTRDIVEGSVVINGLQLNLFDTAGIRKSDDVVESIGIEKAKNLLKQADLVMLVVDDSKDFDAEDKQLLNLIKDYKHIIVQNKADLTTKRDSDKIYISALNQDINKIVEKINELFGVEEESFTRPSLNNSRQLGLLAKIKESLTIAVEEAKNDIPLDLVSVRLQEAYYTTLDILGENNDKDLSVEIFSRFCVGK